MTDTLGANVEGVSESTLKPHLASSRREVGLLFTTREGKAFGSWRVALDTVAVLAGFQKGEVRTRRFRVSYATHRIACEGVEVFDVQRELGHGSLQMLGEVYGRARETRVRFGPHLDFTVDYIAQQVPGLRERVEQMEGDLVARYRQLATAAQREIVAAFVRATAGVPAPQLAAATGLDPATVHRLKLGQPTVHPSNLERIRAWLDARQAG